MKGGAVHTPKSTGSTVFVSGYFYAMQEVSHINKRANSQSTYLRYDNFGIKTCTAKKLLVEIANR